MARQVDLKLRYGPITAAYSVTSSVTTSIELQGVGGG
jgi:hypothetical protein